MIKVRRLVKTFGPKPVLRGLDFQVGQGEFVALLGPNGAGKTTFLRILATLSRPKMGEVTEIFLLSRTCAFMVGCMALVSLTGGWMRCCIW